MWPRNPCKINNSTRQAFMVEVYHRTELLPVILLGLAGKVRLLIMRLTTYPIRTDFKKKKLETVISYLSPNWVQKYWVVFPPWMVAMRGVWPHRWPFFKSCWFCLFLKALGKIVSCLFDFDWCTIEQTDSALYRYVWYSGPLLASIIQYCWTTSV